MKTEIDQTLIGPSSTSVSDALHSAASYLPADSSLEEQAYTSNLCGENCPVCRVSRIFVATSLCRLLKARLVAGQAWFAQHEWRARHDRTLWKRVRELHI
jgi:hypothetical protein